MQFCQVIGQEEATQSLRRQVAEHRFPHALLFCGPEGSGKLATAWALGSLLLCEHPAEGDACGACHACTMTSRLVHPDLHFVFPVIRRKGGKDTPVSDRFLDEWREQMTETPYFSRAAWLDRMGTENQQAQIYAEESSLILRKLSLKTSQGPYKVMIIWQPELMNVTAANKLLKLLEEPPGETVFILVSERPEQLLGTIVSRTQRIDFKPLGEDVLAEALMRDNALDERTARHVARLSGGSFTAAQEHLRANEDAGLFFDMFVRLMRLGYQRKVKDLMAWSEQAASWGRERQKGFLSYCQHLVRENFIYNFKQPGLNYMTPKEADFATGFARFVNAKNVRGIVGELEQAQRDIEQNVNPRMVFFDFSLKMIVLLIMHPATPAPGTVRKG